MPSGRLRRPATELVEFMVRIEPDLAERIRAEAARQNMPIVDLVRAWAETLGE